MREKGQIVKKGTLSEDGSLEFWADGDVTEHMGEKRVKKEETKDLE
jgi:protein import protein ZIM17